MYPPHNGLTVRGPPWGLEKIYDYESGGHHPVHLQDLLHKRYKVIHQLGSGGYANVWLCLDKMSEQSHFVAVKIIMAEGSVETCPELRINNLIELGLEDGASNSLFCCPLDQFQITGPNGLHYAFVYPVLGPRVSRMFHLIGSNDMGRHLRRLCFQAAKAMSILHAKGICHGDFRPANILTHIIGLDGLSEDEVLELVGQPVTTAITLDSGEPHTTDTAPQYLVYPIDWEKIVPRAGNSRFVSGDACVIDFGESFEVNHPPSDLGIPQVYCAPENSLEGVTDVGSDLWALGCTLFEIRTGRKLFDTFDDDKDEYLCRLSIMLGRLPEPWWSKTWEPRKEWFEDEVNDQGQVVEVDRKLDIPERYITDPATGDLIPDRPHEEISRQEPKSLQAAISSGVYYEFKDELGGLQQAIPEEEIEPFADLLYSLLRYVPQQRADASEVLEHPWLRTGI